jgi:hypothetical protein
LYWRSKRSRRHSQEVASNPSVAGNIVKQHELNEYPHAVYFEGQARELGSDEAQIVAQLFAKRLGVNEADILDDAADDEGHKFYKIVVTNWYAFGKFGQKSGHKYELEWNTDV